MKVSRLAVYHSDGAGRLRLARNYVRYTWDRSAGDWQRARQLAGSDTHIVESDRDRLFRSLSERVARIEERIRRLRHYPQYYHDSEVRILEQLSRSLRDLMGQMA